MESQENIAPNEINDDIDEQDEDSKKLWTKIDEILDQYYVSEFQRMALHKFIKVKISDNESDECYRAREWLFLKVNGVKLPKDYHKRQLGCPDLVPGITIKGWWEREEFTWVEKLEKQFDIIKEELLNLRSDLGFQPYRGPSWSGKITPEDKIGSISNEGGDWNVFYLFLHNIKFEEN